MKFGSVSPIAAWILIAAFLALSSTGTSSDDGAQSVLSDVSPLYDYRYTQVAEDLGLLDNGTSEIKLGFESIPTASLSPDDRCQGKDCRLTTEESKEEGDETSMITCVGIQTCSSSCGSTCTQTCSGSCGIVSCGAVTSCGGVYTCGSTCGSTCVDTCTQTCAGTCGLITCGGATSCGGVQTCGNTCGSTSAQTCASTCGSITCRGATSCEGIQTCASTCGNTCGSTCANTCSYTCYSTCFRTCSYTCANTCDRTCARTCSDTCASNCAPINVVPQRNAPMANSTIKTPTAAEQNSAIPYDVRASPPTAVYCNGSDVAWAAFNKSIASNSPLAWAEIFDRSWGTSASAPLGTWVREFVYVPANGSLVLSMTNVGITTKRDFGPTTPGFKYVWFYADRPGAHVSIFSIRGVQSNPVTIFAY